MVSWITTLLFIANIIYVVAVVPSGRANHGCVLLRAKIYCYGGQAITNGTEAVLNTDLFYTLDLSQTKSVGDLQQSWVKYPGSDVGANHYFAMAALPELNRFVIDGGRGGGRNGLTVQVITAVFNANGDGSWNTSLPAGGRSIVESHSAVAENNTVYIAGGRISQLFSGTTGPMQFPQQMTILDVSAGLWSASPASLPSTSSQTRLHNRGAFGNDGQTIFYVGGIYPGTPMDETAAMYYYSAVPMDNILTYNTNTGLWGTRTTTGLLPSTRMDHTLTLKPSTGELIMYGGKQLDTSLPIDDYFYILNTGTMVWSNRSLSTSEGASSAGARHGHSAVLVGNSNLFIIFGSTGDSDADLFVLDIDSWSWINSVNAVVVTTPEPVDGNNSTDSNGGGDGNNQGGNKDGGNDDTGGGSSNAGTIAGAVVGAVAGVAIIAGVLFFFLRRRRTTKQQDIRLDDDVPNGDQLKVQKIRGKFL
ncbi:hypothetical protein BJV82DRAFT_590027 [Fennellomyces sp. T-0311]|nr:hypothetical protein BJV82DRAFT_590027 [Fennellomyces sp. T-0311]